MKNNPLFSYLTFVLDEKVFAIPVFNVKSLMVVDNNVNTSYAGGFVRGVIHINGNTFPFIDLRKVLDPEYNAVIWLKDIILVNLPSYDLNVGLVVDKVGEVIEFSDLKDDRHTRLLRQAGVHAFSTPLL